VAGSHTIPLAAATEVAARRFTTADRRHAVTTRRHAARVYSEAQPEARLSRRVPLSPPVSCSVKHATPPRAAHADFLTTPGSEARGRHRRRDSGRKITDYAPPRRVASSPSRRRRVAARILHGRRTRHMRSAYARHAVSLCGAEANSVRQSSMKRANADTERAKKLIRFRVKPAAEAPGLPAV